MKRAASGPKFARKRTNLFHRYAGLFFLLLVLVFVFWGHLAAKVSNVQFLSVQEVNRIVPLEGVLIKNENVLRAQVGGKLHLTVADGDRLEKGARAAQILAIQTDTGGEAYDIATPVAGICCTHLDGLEQILSPDSIDVLVVPKVEKIGDKATAEGVRVVFLPVNVETEDIPAFQRPFTGRGIVSVRGYIYFLPGINVAGGKTVYAHKLLVRHTVSLGN